MTRSHIFPGVVAYSDTWPCEFQRVATKVRATMQDAALRIDHIGSTSVPDLAAKPVIDIQVTVHALNIVSNYVEALANCDLEYRNDIEEDRPPPWEKPNPDLWRKKYFTSLRPITPRIHLHFREAGKPNQRYALLFRDYLRSNPRACMSYATYKQILAESVGHLSSAGGTGLYLDLKDPVLDLIADAAETWANEVNWSPSPCDA